MSEESWSTIPVQFLPKWDIETAAPMDWYRTQAMYSMGIQDMRGFSERRTAPEAEMRQHLAQAHLDLNTRAVPEATRRHRSKGIRRYGQRIFVLPIPAGSTRSYGLGGRRRIRHRQHRGYCQEHNRRPARADLAEVVRRRNGGIRGHYMGVDFMDCFCSIGDARRCDSCRIAYQRGLSPSELDELIDVAWLTYDYTNNRVWLDELLSIQREAVLSDLQPFVDGE